MAHFAELDENNIVLRVVVINNSDIIDENGIESETKGILFCENLLGGRWIQTSYNANFRKHYAGIGYKYDELKDAFIPPQPYPSWILQEDDYNWMAPKPYPNLDEYYCWNENIIEWELCN